MWNEGAGPTVIDCSPNLLALFHLDWCIPIIFSHLQDPAPPCPASTAAPPLTSPQSRPGGTSSAPLPRSAEAFFIKIQLSRICSQGRLLTQAELLKLGHFRRFLAGSGLGQLDFLYRVEQTRRQREDEESGEVDENGDTAASKGWVQWCGERVSDEWTGHEWNWDVNTKLVQLKN